MKKPMLVSFLFLLTSTTGAEPNRVQPGNWSQIEWQQSIKSVPLEVFNQSDNMEALMLMKMTPEQYQQAMWFKDHPEASCKEADWTQVEWWCEAHRENQSQYKAMKEKADWQEWRHR